MKTKLTTSNIDVGPHHLFNQICTFQEMCKFRRGGCRDVGRLVVVIIYLVVFSTNLYVVNVGLILCCG